MLKKSIDRLTERPEKKLMLVSDTDKGNASIITCRAKHQFCTTAVAEFDQLSGGRNAMKVGFQIGFVYFTVISLLCGSGSGFSYPHSELRVCRLSHLQHDRQSG
jgi:hypothetical protein